MTEPQTLFLAVLVWCGAALAWPVPVWPAALLVVGMLALRRPTLFVAASFMLALALGHRAVTTYQPLAASAYAGSFRLLTDPEEVAFGLRAEARLEQGDRVLLSVDGATASTFRGLGAGDAFVGEGRLVPIHPSRWARSRHLVGELRPSVARHVGGPQWWQQPAEFVRGLVTRGARSFDEEDAALYTGLVIGDDRQQSLAQQTRFRSAGLTHLLAVSGQNVAFALLVVWPLARRLGAVRRLILISAVLFVFALATRLEPSVVRATVTAGLAAWSALVGRPATGVRALSLCVAGLVALDPLLVDSVGFQLSVAATAGILVVGPVLVKRLPGPRALKEVVAVTVSAQIGVVPLLLFFFGPVSLVTVPANILVGWAAGLVMVWGLTVGVVAGLVPQSAGWIQWPVGLLLSWIDGVAAWASRVPAPRLGGLALVLLVALSVAAWWSGPRTRRVVLILLLVSGWGLTARSPTARTELTGGGVYWPATRLTPSVLLVERSADRRLLEEVIFRRVTSVDIVVLERAGRSSRPVIRAITELVSPGLILAPPQHVIVGARRVTEMSVLSLSDGELRLVPDEDALIINLD